MYMYTPRSIKFVLYIHVAQKITVAVKHHIFFKNLSVLLIKDQLPLAPPVLIGFFMAPEDLVFDFAINFTRNFFRVQLDQAILEWEIP